MNDNGRTRHSTPLDIIKLNADNFYEWDKNVKLVVKAINEDIYKRLRGLTGEPDYTIPTLTK